MMVSMLTTAILAGAWAASPATSDASAPGATNHPHIVILFVDDMGYGDAGCYNSASKIPSPHIDGLASAGMRFTDAHAPGPLCHPSRYGLLTGRYPFRTDVSVWPRQALIEEGRMTVASLLQSGGYRTVMIGKWHLGFDEQGYDQPLPGGPANRGFDQFFGIRASTDIPPYFYIRGDRAVELPTEQISDNQSPGWSPIQGAFWRSGGIAPNLKLEDVLPRFTDESIAAIQSHGNRPGKSPLFLYVALPAPHTPWLPSEPFAGRSPAGMYGDFLMMVDHEIGRVLKTLDQAGMADDTLVIFTSDNGPVWYPVDVERFGHDSAGGLRGMKGDVWEAGHRMPFIVRWPGKVEPGSVSRQVISFTDLLATFAAILDTELPRDAGEDSFNVLPVLLGDQPDDKPIRPAVVVPAMTGMLSIRSGPWKLIEGLGSGGFSQPRRIEPEPGGPAGQLYHLDDDPGETKNLWLARPDIRDRLLAELKQVRTSGRSRPE
jgi:arylsulfatase A